MNKKPGLQFKLGGEGLMYVIIIIIIFAFILLMPNIYKLISKLKTGDLFKNKETPIVENSNQNIGEQNNSRNFTLKCEKTDSTVDGNYVDTYTFYYNDNRLVKVINNKNYDAITDDYLLEINDAYSLFERINQQYKNVSGFSYDSSFEHRVLDANFLYDLTLLDLENLYSIAE